MQLNECSKFANISDDLILGLRRRHSSLHPLIFLRSVERSDRISELFDILDTVPDFPLSWCENEHKWVSMSNLLTTNA